MIRMESSRVLWAGLALLLIAVSVSAQGVVTYDVDFLSEDDYEDGKDRMDI